MNTDKITIAGDFYFPEKYAEFPFNELIDDKLTSLLADSFSIINLEAPICKPDSKHKILKSGPHLHQPEKCLSFLNYMNFSLLTLANNHIYDYGAYGLSNTLQLCKDNNFDTVGAGMTEEEASQIYFKEFNNGLVAILNFSENEWSTASNSSPGANPLDVVNNAYAINKAKNEADVVIVIIHGGHERYSLPSPRMTKLYRFYADQGANVIINHHTHYYSGYEIYKNCPIFYGLGNFFFPSNQEQEEWNYGTLIELAISSKKQLSFKIHPYQQGLNSTLIQKLVDEKEKSILDNINRLNEIITNHDQLLESWNSYIAHNESYTLNIFNNYNFIPVGILKKALKKTKLNKFFLTPQIAKYILNYIRCESHRDVSLEVLKKYLKI